jgi:glutathione S-transferase
MMCGTRRNQKEPAVIVVHHLNDSSSQRILWLLEELDVPYEVKCYQRDARTRRAPPELKVIHLLGKSPVITDDGKVVAESGTIIDYILRRHGHGRLRPGPASTSYDDYVHWMHYAEGSAMPALIVSRNAR